MADISRELLAGYLDDALGDAETAQVEQALRDSDKLRSELRNMIQERDRGEHSLGAIWRRHRLSCPGRDQLRAYLLHALEDGLRDYIRFHLDVIACAFCQANLADLNSRQHEPKARVDKRRRKMFESSAPFLEAPRRKSTS